MALVMMSTLCHMMGADAWSGTKRTVKNKTEMFGNREMF